MNENSARTISRLFWLDVVRGLSAVAVCANHLRTVFFCDSAEIVSREPWQAPFYLATGLGHQAVIVFFVLSGYLVGGTVIRKRQSFEWINYSVARLSRLWTVLIPSLIATAIIDALVMYLAPGTLSGQYHDLWNSGPASDYSLSPYTFFGNILFLQTILTPVYGSNGPLWSLANEFWYYVLFPLIMAIFYPRVRAASIAYVVSAAILLVWLPKELVLYGGIWCLGVLIYCLRDFHANLKRSKLLTAFALMMLTISLVNSKLKFTERISLEWIPNDIIVGLAFAFLTWILISLNKAERNRYAEAFFRWLSDISYTLYLFHFPMVVFLGGVILKGEQSQPTKYMSVCYSVCLFAIILLCYGAWWIFERNTEVVRGYMSSALNSRKKKAAQAQPSK